jgi:proteasome lid subunit RPN8/RPN11
MRDPAKHPWVHGKLRIARAVLGRVYEEATLGYAKDEESCGVLTGPASQPLLLDGIVPMENRANKLHALDPETYPRTGRMYFDLNPMAFEREIREREARGQPVKVLYHSHLDVGAYFSETDAAAATMGGSEPSYDLAYLVTSVTKRASGSLGGHPRTQTPVELELVHALFVWDEATRGFVQGELSVVGDAGVGDTGTIP